MGDTVMTVGHSTMPMESFVKLLTTHGVEMIVDIRRFPGSRRHPQFGKEALAAALAAAGIGYEHLQTLGGRRAPLTDSPHTGLRKAQFRGYADHMGTAEFGAGVVRLLALARASTTAVMCAESLPWRCHRNLLADALTVRDVVVEHIMDRATRRTHERTRWARVEGTSIVYAPPEQLGLD